jgi:hypothetical protein
VEQLERRDCPSAPTLSFTVTQAGGHNVVLSGSVTDDNPSSCTVAFTGVVTATANVGANGAFSVTATASALGTITGQATDGAGQTSAAVQQTLADAAPTIVNFLAVQDGGNCWTFTGTVQDAYAAGLTITLGGLPELQGVTVTTDASGNFTYTCQLAVGESGTATAITTDGWSLESNEAEVYVNPVSSSSGSFGGV